VQVVLDCFAWEISRKTTNSTRSQSSVYISLSLYTHTHTHTHLYCAHTIFTETIVPVYFSFFLAREFDYIGCKYPPPEGEKEIALGIVNARRVWIHILLYISLYIIILYTDRRSTCRVVGGILSFRISYENLYMSRFTYLYMYI